MTDNLELNRSFVHLSAEDLQSVDGGVAPLVVFGVVITKKLVATAVVKGVISGAAAYGTKKALGAIFD